MDRIKPLSMLGETLTRNLSDIRELINQARRQAASVRTRTCTHTAYSHDDVTHDILVTPSDQGGSAG